MSGVCTQLVHHALLCKTMHCYFDHMKNIVNKDNHANPFDATTVKTGSKVRVVVAISSLFF